MSERYERLKKAGLIGCMKDSEKFEYMNEWISVKERLPEPRGLDRDTSWYVWVTDGYCIEIAQYIHRPRNYGCAVDDDDQDATCGPEPHWHIDESGTPFKEGDKCLGYIENAEITHWMPLPNAPEKLKE